MIKFRIESVLRIYKEDQKILIPEHKRMRFSGKDFFFDVMLN